VRLCRTYRHGDEKNLIQFNHKVRKLLFALETANTLEQVKRFPGWKLHPLRGEFEGLWSLTVTGNWRLTFRCDEETNTASDLNLVDYH
jgi:proteic killer suppression protein